VQPAVTSDGDVLMSVASGAEGEGMRRIAVVHGPGGWAVEERWRSIGLKPYFNDFVVHNGQAFGFDGSILACIDVKDGKRQWKGGRYGNGQLILLPDQDLLLVLSEEGELAPWPPARARTPSRRPRKRSLSRICESCYSYSFCYCKLSAIGFQSRRRG
jgi:hypothetical protein